MSRHAPSQGDMIIPGHKTPDELYIIPVYNRPFLPTQILPIQIQADPWEKTLHAVNQTDHRMVGLFYVDEERLGPEQEHSLALRLSKTGCMARVHHATKVHHGIQFVAEGLCRIQIKQWLTNSAPYLVEVDYPKGHEGPPAQVKAYAMALISTLKELLPLNPLYTEELKQYLNRFNPNEPSELADCAAAITTAKGALLQQVLDTCDLMPRMEQVLALLKDEMEVARLQTRISKEVDKNIQERQREFFLREQLKVIQKELGIAKDDKTADLETFEERLQNKKIPGAVQQRIDEELDKFSILETGSPEYAVTRNYLEWITALPWGVFCSNHFSLEQARAILDEDHQGLEDVKQRIFEFLAVSRYKGEIIGSILLLIGPPGVGKTSVGRSVARALDRPFYRFSVGGMRDEAEIKGHRRTYIGALPGKLVQALKECQVMNPVIMLDEIDKMGVSYQGDPASALLETLDPEQNNQFLDHYLDLRLDLSHCLFICTANTLDHIPPALLDRMETIRLAGYLDYEKLAIAIHHLWPRQLDRAGVAPKLLTITQGALKLIIEGYAREAGVRQLEKQLAKIIRKSVVQLVTDKERKIKITKRQIKELLGPAPYRKEKRLQGVGIVTGLAWTSLGGETLSIEATQIHQLQSGLKLTGQLGDVMQESASIAYSYLCSQPQLYPCHPDFFEKAQIHLHIPEGATPKDGPSAGITMACALLSLARDQPLMSSIAMTGEMTLTGHILPVGGIREKLIAARRQKIQEVILPATNKGDYEELPEYIRHDLRIHFARHFRDLVKLLFK
ncbi:endopeptidase La [Dongshaea marina]|uniref:endopeptidase La n=1 Tax=Dongshaea marina TaxID=2047966 RepID=UPI000D3EA3CC|nr:endopeptidase La [Dongshaea marina]